MTKLAAEELFAYAVKLLSIRANSSEDLRAKLKRKAEVSSDADSTIARLIEIGYLNDHRYAENYASARKDNDGFGKFRVLMDLRRKRVGSEMAQQAVEGVFEGTNEPDLIDEFVNRKMGSIAAGGVNDQKKLAAAYRRLRRAGFSSGPVIDALKRYAARPEELEEPPASEDEENAEDEMEN